MIVQPEIVTLAFAIAAAICMIDIFRADRWRMRVIRICQVIVLAFAAGYYAQAAAINALPSSDLRVVWICLAAVISAEVISRWQVRLWRDKL